MNICNTFKETYSEFKDTYDTFINLYFAKRAILMLENVHGELEISNVTEQQKDTVQEILKNITTLYEFSAFVKMYKRSLEKEVPSNLFSEWSEDDFVSFTDKYHHKKFWNKIENHPIIDALIKKFCTLYPDCKIRTYTGRDPEECTWLLSLYDFNNFNLYFESKKDLEDFAMHFELEPYTVYLWKAGENLWVEEYSV